MTPETNWYRSEDEDEIVHKLEPRARTAVLPPVMAKSVDNHAVSWVAFEENAILTACWDGEYFFFLLAIVFLCFILGFTFPFACSSLLSAQAPWPWNHDLDPRDGVLDILSPDITVYDYIADLVLKAATVRSKHVFSFIKSTRNTESIPSWPEISITCFGAQIVTKPAKTVT